jgi:capsular polysaccharide biosynthesis protein
MRGRPKNDTGMTAPLKMLQSETTLLRAHREEIAQRTAKALWEGKWRILATLAAALLLAGVALVLIKPRYTGEAMIQFDFSREISEQNANVKVQPVAVLEAAVLVEGAARLIRSRATAWAVVARLKLDQDPNFLHEPILLRWLSVARSFLGLEAAASAPSNGELAIRSLMRQVVVKSEPRSYLVSIEATADNPKQAALLSNTVAMEYLRSQLAQRHSEAQAAAERELAQVSSIYGVRHPNYLRVQATLKRIKEDSIALAEGHDVTGDFGLEMGQSLIPADTAAIPSVPNINLTLVSAAVVGLIVGGGWALRTQKSRANKAPAKRQS